MPKDEFATMVVKDGLAVPAMGDESTSVSRAFLPALTSKNIAEPKTYRATKISANQLLTMMV